KHVTLYHGDCIEVMRNLPESSVDAIVTDPPYGLGFMGAKWDALPPGKDWAEECLRVLKPGGHLLAFGGTRTWHRLAVAIEDAGFEIRDSVMWLYGSGFPKSHDVSKGIDKQRKEDRGPVDAVRSWLNARRLESGVSHDAVNKHFGHASNGGGSSSAWMTNPTSRSLPTWEQWQELKALFGFGDDMDAEVLRLNGRKGKPGDAYGEREVLSTRQVADIRNGHGREYGGAMFAGEKTGKIEHATTAPATDAAKQWDGWGTALKPAVEPIVAARKPFKGTVAANVLEHGTGALNIDASRIEGEPTPVNRLEEWSGFGQKVRPTYSQTMNTKGRWPANVILDERMAGALDEQSGVLKSGARTPTGGEQKGDVYGLGHKTSGTNTFASSEGGASRFFYVAKAPKRERPEVNGVKHTTVKPLTLMRYLVRMVTPPGGIVLDPFVGSGTTIEAALLEGFQSIGIELTDEYLPLIQQRIQRQEVIE